MRSSQARTRANVASELATSVIHERELVLRLLLLPGEVRWLLLVLEASGSEREARSMCLKALLLAFFVF